MILKKINRLTVTALSATLLAVGACDVTDQTPVTLVPEEEAFSDAGKVQGNILGVYDAAQRGWYLGAIQRGYPFGAASIQQGDMRSGDMYNDQLFYEVTYINGWTPSTANNEGQWIGTYRLINRINVVLEGIETALANSVITQEQYDSYRGELLFLRGFSHWDLVINFSRPFSDDPSLFGIPYRDFAINNTDRVTEGEGLDRGTVQETYDKVLADLDLAEGLATDIGPFRASTGAVIAFKTRVKLHQEDWAGVLEEFEKLTQYALAESPDAPFSSPDGNPESIFSFNNTPESNPGTNGALAAMYGNPAEGGRGLVKISPLIWNEPFWLQGDARRTTLTSEGPQGIYTTKYTGYINRDDPSPMLRYAEAVLNAAEANARLGNLDVAVELLNSVRERSVPIGTPAFTAGGLGGMMDVLQAIWNERRVEFLAEGIYWYDIHRLSGRGDLPGIPGKAPSRSITSIDFYAPGTVINPDHSLPYSSNLFVWPIPLQEIVNNPVLAAQQNPGY